MGKSKTNIALKHAQTPVTTDIPTPERARYNNLQKMYLNHSLELKKYIFITYTPINKKKVDKYCIIKIRRFINHYLTLFDKKITLDVKNNYESSQLQLRLSQ